ncbi:hypothetical protein OI69_03290 [Pectobacterium fontis]|uniref:Uncharacterized protein n=1 Tax=Pectobacterium fontis TaxID=2558042 RepID=A0A7V8L7H1_9GAMM|nr:hypothetical protein OI69_03290 [Pectobacterium fontis]
MDIPNRNKEIKYLVPIYDSPKNQTNHTSGINKDINTGMGIMKIEYSANLMILFLFNLPLLNFS